MKLHSPGFEKALRHSVHRALRSSPELKREHRRANRVRRANWIVWLGMLAWVGFGGLAVWGSTARTGHVAVGLAVINLIMLGSLHLLAQSLWKRLHASTDNAALALMPVSRECFFRWQWQQFVGHSLLMLAVLLLNFGVLAFFLDFPPWKWAAAFLIALVCWVTLLALTAFCAARLIRGPLAMVTTGLFVLGFAILVGRPFVLPLVLHALDQAAPELNLVLPTGWPVSLFQTLTADQPAWFLVLLVPVGLILWTLRNSRRRLFDGFQYQERIIAESPDLVPGAAADQPVRLVPTAIEEIILSRNFLSPPAWPQRGWLERQLLRWFNPREQALADFVFPNGLAITARWLGILKWFGATAVTAWVAGWISATFQHWVLGIGLFFTSLQMLGQIINHGRAFQLLRFSGVQIPMHAGYGVGFRELSRLLSKCALLQLPLLLAFGQLAGVTTAWLAGLPLVAGWSFGLKTGCLLFASRLIFVILAFHSGTSDTSRFRFRSVLLAVAMTVPSLLFAGLGMCSLVVPQPLAAWLLGCGAVLDAYALVWIFQWFFQAGRFDLMRRLRW